MKDRYKFQVIRSPYYGDSSDDEHIEQGLDDIRDNVFGLINGVYGKFRISEFTRETSEFSYTLSCDDEHAVELMTFCQCMGNIISNDVRFEVNIEIL